MSRASLNKSSRVQKLSGPPATWSVVPKGGERKERPNLRVSCRAGLQGLEYCVLVRSITSPVLDKHLGCQQEGYAAPGVLPWFLLLFWGQPAKGGPIVVWDPPPPQLSNSFNYLPAIALRWQNTSDERTGCSADAIVSLIVSAP